MKRLAVLVMIPALSILMATAMASADGDNYWRGLHGDYAMIATGSCLHSQPGFIQVTPSNGTLPFWKPIPDAKVWGASTMAQATWTFERDGTGQVWGGTNYVIDFPPGAPNFGSPVARKNAILFPFRYEVTPDGAITVYPPSPPNFVGMISRDHKTLTLGSADTVQAWPGGGEVICNIGRVLIRVKEVDD